MQGEAWPQDICIASYLHPLSLHYATINSIALSVQAFAISLGPLVPMSTLIYIVSTTLAKADGHTLRIVRPIHRQHNTE